MPPTTYGDLAQFGLPFVTAHDAAFPHLLQEIQNRPRSGDPIDRGAILLNQSGKAIVALGVNWKYTIRGQTRLSRLSNLASSMQLDVFSGRGTVTRDFNSFILHGSNRLITEAGVFGDNLDVLSPELSERYRGMGFGGGGGGSSRRRRRDDEITAIDLQLDVVFFDDGLCVGPDEFGLFESLMTEVERQRSTSQQITEALRGGASRGQVFEILRPLALAAGPEYTSEGRVVHSANLLQMFAKIAIDHLVDMPGEELLEWFEAGARPSPMLLHRP